VSEPPDRIESDALELSSEHLGVRVWAVQGRSQQELIDRIALILGEHMDPSDELTISYNAMQTGSQPHLHQRVFKPDEKWTELFFEYSALIVLRSRS
jgi:hypothetical protein